MIGDIELTEYDFQCPSCERITEYDEQCAIGKVQKRLRKHILLQEEIDENIDQAKTVIAKQRKIRGIAVKIVSFALAVFILYMWLRSGDFSFTLYF